MWKLNRWKKNLSLLDEFFESSPAAYAKMLINTKNADENKEFVEEIKKYISDLNDRIKKMSKKEKKDKNEDKTLEIINKILDYNKAVQKFFIVHQKLIKKSETNIEESIAERVK